MAAKEQRLATYDFLRGLAILGVLAVHTCQAFPTGYQYADFTIGLGRFGVQLFFYVSALTMCHMWQLRQTEEHRTRKFFIRRVFRIAPLFWAAIPVYLMLNGTDPSYFAPEGISTHQIVLTALFLHGFWPDSINCVVPGGWSIAVEMTFYAIFPLLMRRFESRGFQLLLVAVAFWALNVFLFRWAAQAALADVYITRSETIIPDFLKLNFMSQAPIFLVGCYIFSLREQKPQRSEVLIFIAWLIAGALLQFFVSLSGFDFLVVYLAIGLFVYLCLKLGVNSQPIELIGKKSYAIYLSHFLVLYLLKDIIPANKGPTEFFIGFLLNIAISYLIATIIFYSVERPVHRSVESFLNKRQRLAS